MGLTYRFIIFVPTLLVVSFICFILMESRPGNFFSATSEFSIAPSAQQTEQYLSLYGLRQSLLHRYGQWLKNLVIKHSWGESLAYQQSVSSLLKGRLANTLNLTLLIACLKWGLTVPLSLYASCKPAPPGKSALNLLSQLSLSTPDFFLAVLAVQLSIQLPVISNHLFFCAALVGFLSGFGALFSILKTRFTEIREEPFIRNLSVQGLSSVLIHYRVLRHGLPLMISVFANELPAFLSGAMIISIVFNLPTLGPFLQNAIMMHDTNLIMAIVMILAVLVQFGQLLADAVLFLWAVPYSRNGVSVR